MSEQRTEGFEKLKGRLFSYLVKRSVLAPAEALEGIPGEALTVAFERFLHEIVLCLVQEDALVNIAGAMVDKEAKMECPALSAGILVSSNSAGAFVGD